MQRGVLSSQVWHAKQTLSPHDQLTFPLQIFHIQNNMLACSLTQNRGLATTSIKSNVLTGAFRVDYDGEMGTKDIFMQRVGEGAATPCTAWVGRSATVEGRRTWRNQVLNALSSRKLPPRAPLQNGLASPLQSLVPDEMITNFRVA